MLPSEERSAQHFRPPSKLIEPTEKFLGDSLIPGEWGLLEPKLNFLFRIFKELFSFFSRNVASTYMPKSGEFSDYWLRIIRLLKREGIIEEISLRRNYTDGPQFFRYGVKISGDGDIYGAGAEAIPEKALASALGEALERYSLSVFSKDFPALKIASYKTLRRRAWRAGALNPEELARFPREKRAGGTRFYFNEDTIFHWVKGYSLFEKKPYWIPAQFVFWNYRLRERREPMLREPNTNGAALYRSRDEAILRGLYELIERDAFMIFWLNQIAPPRIDPASIPDLEIRDIIRRFERYNLELTLLNATADLEIPVAVAVLRDFAGLPHLAVSAGCSLNPLAALRRSILEVWQVWSGARSSCEKDSSSARLLMKDFPAFNSQLSQNGRMFLWANPENGKYLNFFLKGPLQPFFPAALPAGDKPLAIVLKRLRERGMRVFIYERRLPVLEKLGLRAVKAIVPELQHLYLYEEYAELAGKRLSEALRVLGRSAPPALNPCPHPFP